MAENSNRSRRPRAAPRGTRREARRPKDQGERESTGPGNFRERLRRDPFLFAMCLGFLAFSTSAFAVGWRVLSDPILLVFAVLSVPPAFVLFYLRDASPA